MKLQIIFLLFNVVAEFEISQKNYVTRSEIVQEKQESRTKWSQNVIKKIKKESKIYQIMLIAKCENLMHNKIIQDLQENLPTLYFNDTYLKREIQHLEKRNSLRNPRGTTLFLVVESPEQDNTQWTEEIMAFITHLSTVHSRPKCFILHFLDSNKTSNYSKFLQKMWQDLFLDVTILDVIKERATIHHLNPYVSYKSKHFTSKTSLFPDKLRNLNEHSLKIGIFNRPPFIKMKRNSTNFPVDVVGPDAEIGNFFAKMLNYQQIFVPSNEDDFGNFDCNVDKLGGFFSEIQQNKIQFISVSSATIRNVCNKESLENTIFSLDHFVAIIPTLKSKNLSIMVGNTFYYSILLTVLIIITSWIIVNTLKFEKTIWNWTIVIQIVFGITAMYQPIKLKERIIFGCFLIINFYYSLNILTSLTDFNYRMEVEKEINTLNDLIKSGLQFGSELVKIMVLPGVFNQQDFTDWLKNARAFTYEECVEFLLNYKNVTCIMELSHAEWHAGFYRKQNLVKFIPEFILSVGYGFILEPGSPYVEKFQQIHRSLTEFVLLKKWQMKKVQNATKYNQLITITEEKLKGLDESNDEWKVNSLLIGILITGFSASILSFVVELVIDKWKRRQKCKKIIASKPTK